MTVPRILGTFDGFCMPGMKGKEVAKKSAPKAAAAEKPTAAARRAPPAKSAAPVSITTFLTKRIQIVSFLDGLHERSVGKL